MPIGKGGRTMSYHNRGRVPARGKRPARPVRRARGGRVPRNVATRRRR